jgi:hypothetical protein
MAGVSEMVLHWRTVASTIAAALLISYAALLAFTDLGAFAVGPAGMVWLILTALLAGLLLGLSAEEGANPLLAAAAAVGLAIVIFILGWGYVAWISLQGSVSYWSLLGSARLFNFLIQRGFLVLVVCAPACLLTAAVSMRR